MQLKLTSRLERGMGPDRRIDSMEFHLDHISKSLHAFHFGSLVAKNHFVQQRIAVLQAKMADCIGAALHLGYSPEELSAAKTALHEKLIVPDVPPAANSLSELTGLAIKLRLIKMDYPHWAPLIYYQFPTTLAAAAAIKKAQFRYGTLIFRRDDDDLEGVVDGADLISSSDAAWMSDHRLSAVVAEARRLEQCPLEESVVTLALELDQLRADLGPSSEGGALAKAKRRQRKVRGEISKALLLWTFWDQLDSSTGEACEGWEAEAKAASAKIMGKSESEPEISRSFPWEDGEEVAAGEGSLPRRLVLTYLDVWNELQRSLEELNYFLPHELRRSLAYFDIYEAELVRVIGSLDRSIPDLRQSLSATSSTSSNNAANADELDFLLFRRGYLTGRLQYVHAQQARGRHAVAIWYGEGKPFPLLPASLVSSAGDATMVDAPSPRDADEAEADLGNSEDEMPGRLAAGRAARSALEQLAQASDDSNVEESDDDRDVDGF